jgi:hypothetical protein
MQVASPAFEIGLTVLVHPSDPAMAANVTPNPLAGAVDALRLADACLLRHSNHYLPADTLENVAALLLGGTR